MRVRVAEWRKYERQIIVETQPSYAQTNLLKSPEQIKREFEEKGLSFTQWAEENGYAREYVSRVLNGSICATRGKGHEIAVKLGLKAAA